MITLSALALCAQQALILYVSPTGSDTNAGTSAAPLKTIAKAAKLVSARTSNTTPATINLEAGDYLLGNQVNLDSTDNNLTIKGTGARILGSTVLTTWTALGSDSYASTFPAAARPNILEADLNSQVTSSALATLKLASNALSIDVLEDRVPLALAQFPAAGSWLTTSHSTSGSTLGWTSTVPESWTGLTQVWMAGYPIYDWNYVNAPLTNVNVSAMTAHLGNSVTALPGSRFQFVNVPQALSAPGEYYLNRATMKLYFWPANPSFSELAINTCSDPMFNLIGAANVHFYGLTLQGSLTNAIYAQQSTSVTVSNCVLNGCSGQPLQFSACLYCQIVNSTISNCGSSAISLADGSLSMPSGDVISNCTISNFSRLARTWPAIQLQGGGTVVTHNLIQDGPFDAIVLFGPNYQITYNSINNVDFEVSDAGAIYEGRQPLARGLTVRNNLFQNVTQNITPNSQTSPGVAQVYLDDMQPGATVEGNIFEGGGNGVEVGGGRDNTVEYNVFLGDTLGILLDARGTSWAFSSATFGGSWDFMDSLQSELLTVPAFVRTFPLAKDALTNQPYFPVRFNSSRNVFVGPQSQFISYQDTTGPNNTTCLNNVFLSSATLQAALAAVPSGYVMPTLAQIGPQH